MREVLAAVLAAGVADNWHSAIFRWLEAVERMTCHQTCEIAANQCIAEVDSYCSEMSLGLDRIENRGGG